MTELPVRMIAMDMDGTLLTHCSDGPSYISRANLAALRLAHERGIVTVIASGRMPDDAGAFAVDARLPMAILSLNGACIQREAMGPIVKSSPLPGDAAARVWHRALAMGLEVGLFGGHTLVTSRPLETEADWNRWGTWLRRPGTRCVVRDRGQGAEELLSAGAHKLVLLADTEEPLPLLKKELEATEPELEISSSWARNLEVNARGVHKGMALRQLAEELHIPMNRVMAIGDNGNDIPMLREAGIGVAMGNGTAETKAACGWVTRTVGEDGVAAAIRHLALGLPERGVMPQ